MKYPGAKVLIYNPSPTLRMNNFSINLQLLLKRSRSESTVKLSGNRMSNNLFCFNKTLKNQEPTPHMSDKDAKTK